MKEAIAATAINKIPDQQGLVPLGDLGPLYHARLAASPTEEWSVTDQPSNSGHNHAFDGVLYLTPHKNEAAFHVRNVENSQIYQMKVADSSAFVMSGKQLDGSIFKGLELELDKTLPPKNEIESRALELFNSVDPSEYTQELVSYSLHSKVEHFAAKYKPEEIDGEEWKRAVERYVYAKNALRVLETGDAAFILAAINDRGVDPEIRLVYGRVAEINGEVIERWIPVNREYLLRSLVSRNIVGFTTTIDRFGMRRTGIGSGAVFNDAVMLWKPTAVQAESRIDDLEVDKLTSEARATGQIVLNGEVGIVSL